MHKEICYKELAHINMEAEIPKFVSEESVGH